VTVTSIIHSRLRAWAAGSYPLEAAVELLVRAFGGRFANPAYPWIEHADSDRPWLNADTMTDNELAALSGGEQRLLRIVRSLAGGEPVRLDENVPGLDRDRMHLVLAALAHANGSYEHPGPMTFDDAGRPTGFGPPRGTLYPWPTP